MSRRSRKIRSAWRAWASFTQWEPFRRGYLAALDESLRPMTETTKQEAVERAFRRTYGIEEA